MTHNEKTDDLLNVLIVTSESNKPYKRAGILDNLSYLSITLVTTAMLYKIGESYNIIPISVIIILVLNYILYKYLYFKHVCKIEFYKQRLMIFTPVHEIEYEINSLENVEIIWLGILRYFRLIIYKKGQKGSNKYGIVVRDTNWGSSKETSKSLKSKFAKLYGIKSKGDS